MNKQKTNIIVVGLLKTGSSALIDMLSEYDNINLIPGEFDDYRAPGLVSDQLKEDISLTPIYEISQITSFRRKLRKLYDVFPIFHLQSNSLKILRSQYKLSILRIRQLNLLGKLNRKLASDISIEQKIKFANQWIADIGNINKRNSDFVLYNNSLDVVNDIQVWKQVFNPCKLIVVYRNPKDQIADIIKNKYLFAPYGAPIMNFGGVTLETIYGRSRKSAMNFHIDAIKKRYEWVASLEKELNPDQFLLIDFEGLAKNYVQYKNKIESFIGNPKSNHKHQKRYFDPEKAKNSIDIYKDHLDEKEVEQLNELDDWYNKFIINNPIQN